MFSLIIAVALLGGGDNKYWEGYASVLIAEEVLQRKEAGIHSIGPVKPNPKPKEPTGEVAPDQACPSGCSSCKLNVNIPSLNLNIDVPQTPSEKENAKEEEEAACPTCSGRRGRILGNGWW